MTDSGNDSPRTDRIAPAAVPTRRRRWWRIVLYLVIFASGVIVGGGGALLAVRSGALYAVHHPDEMPARIAARMAGKLSLSDEQEREVERILRERQNALQAIRREFQPRVEAELDRVEEQVSAVLDARQRANWQARFDYLRRTWVPETPADDD